MRFMQIESVLQTINRSEPAKNRFSVALGQMANVKTEYPPPPKTGTGLVQVLRIEESTRQIWVNLPMIAHLTGKTL